MDLTLIGSRQAQRVAQDIIILYHVCLIFLFIDHAIYPAAVAPPGGGATGKSCPPTFVLGCFSILANLLRKFFRGYTPDHPKILSVRCSTNETSREMQSTV